MNAIHSAVAAAIIVTASLAANLLAIVAVGPASASPLLRVRLGLRRSPRHVKRLVDTWVAVMLARRERQAALWAEDQLRGRKLGAPSRPPGRLR